MRGVLASAVVIAALCAPAGALAQDLDLERVTTGPSGGNVDTYTGRDR